MKRIAYFMSATAALAFAGYIWVGAQPNSLLYDTGSFQFSPHTVHRLSLNGDGHDDYVLLEGEDDYYRSSILLATARTESYTDSSLFLAYEQEVGPYVAIIDPDGDGHPEILASTIFEPANQCDGLGIVQVPDSVLAAAINEYWRIVGDFDQQNFKYGGMKEYPMFNLGLERSVRILRAKGLELFDVTRAFPRHLAWRRRTLSILADATVADTAQLPRGLPNEQQRAAITARLQCAAGLRQLISTLPME